MDAQHEQIEEAATLSEKGRAAAAEAAEAQAAAEAFRKKAAAGKQEVRKTWITFFGSGAVVLALVVIFFATMAWFVSAQQDKGTGMVVKPSEQPLMVDDYEFYYYKRTIGATTHDKTFEIQSLTSKDVEEGGALPVNMVPYDLLSADPTCNSHTPIVVRFPVSGDALAVSGSDTETLTIKITNKGGAWSSSGTKVDYLFSNITQVQCAVDSGHQSAGKSISTDTEEIWNLGKSAVSGTTAQTFVTLDDPPTLTGPTKTDTISFDVTVSSADVADNGKAYIFLMVDYNESLSKALIRLNGVVGSSIGESSSVVTFEKDFKDVLVEEKTD